MGGFRHGGPSPELGTDLFVACCAGLLRVCTVRRILSAFQSPAGLYDWSMPTSVVLPVPRGLVLLLALSTAPGTGLAQPRAEQVDPPALAAAAARLGRVRRQ